MSRWGFCGAGSRLPLVVSLLSLAAAPAVFAGPPFLTDDPEPTETGHWEIYAPALEGSGVGRDFDGSLGAELNFGAAPDVQITVGLPVSFSHSADGFEAGRGDLELSVKYRFFHDEAAGVSIAAFPGISLPTARRGLGASNATALLPVWAQKDAGPWSVFGGGGYAINPGAGNRDFWTGGLAVSRRMSERLMLGVEIDREGADSLGGSPKTSVGVGAILKLKTPFRLLASAGPTFPDHGGAAALHAFAALGLDF